MLDRTDRSLVGVWWWTVDKWLLASALMLIVIGTLLVMAAGPAVANLIQLSSQHFIIRQLIYLIPTLGLMVAVSMLEPRTIRAFAFFGLTLIIGLMVMAIVMGSEVKGATRWVSIAGFSIQPSELAKPLFAIVSAWLLTLWREGQDFPGWAYATALLGIIVAILVAQPDIGMTLMMLLTWGFQMSPQRCSMWLICIYRMLPCGLINFLKAGHGRWNAPWRVLPQVAILALVRVMGG